jgi:hypothetical protein
LQFAGLGGPPTKWSPSSAVITNSVLALVMPALARPAKKVPNAAFSCFSCDSYVAEPEPRPAPVVHESLYGARSPRHGESECFRDVSCSQFSGGRVKWQEISQFGMRDRPSAVSRRPLPVVA